MSTSVAARSGCERSGAHLRCQRDPSRPAASARAAAATIENKASDVHLKVGSHPVVRIDGKLEPLTRFSRLMQDDTVGMAFSMMNARQKQRFKEDLEIDIAYSVPGLGRFRCNVFQQRGSVGLVLRVIPATILNIRELMLPPVLEKICEERRGLVLAGRRCTGSGPDPAPSNRCRSPSPP